MAADPVILVTAGSAGLGRAVALHFARNGYRVAFNYNSNESRAATLLSELKVASNRDHFHIQADLSSRTEVGRLVRETHGRTGRLDVVFSDVGWSQFRDTCRLDDNLFEADWDRAYTMNVKSHLWLLQATMPHLAETEGCFVTTSSIAAAYGVSKAAQIHMMKGVATMVGPGIHQEKEQHKNRTRLKRFVRLEDVAEQVLSLAKNRSITGVNIVIDAGFVR
ncbi:3-oxoacyl-[acyl-carrier-protein] reductase FabG [Beauveria bassiana]|uniref:3-oxoacyl-[acyl-carrier-protein] reductase FabG n=1 Tax=Beauveria bassiana TaxID=176275 RepID=A0A2N6NB97_BEABA|nr:3-oxoacyl-[acyl-carrier-protein] reductase FabG [Beauveria bassiana]